MRDDERDPFPEIESRIRKGRDRLKRIGPLLKEIRKCNAEPDKSAFTLIEKLKDLDRIIKDLAEMGDLAPLLHGLSTGISKRAEDALRNAKTAVTASLARGLEENGLGLEGNLPLLSCGVLTLEFIFESEGKMNLYFGPRIEKIKQVRIDAEEITASILSIYGWLDGSGFDEEEHVGLLLKAYMNAARLLNVERGSAIPISDVILQTAILRQDKKFILDPVRESFSGYGRMRFAYDLSRTRIRSVNGEELHMMVASMEQTRRQGAHLWVPRGPRDIKGTHFSTLAFRRAAR